jgi:acetyltransferase
MIDAPDGFELILGSKRDSTFGAVLMVGAGGIATEIIHDRALGLPPLNERLARRMLESLTSWPLLLGYRGKPGVDLDRVIDILLRLSYLVGDHPEISELDINPLLATDHGAIALDAQVSIDRSIMECQHRPFSHLAIRPYPSELVRRATLRDGTPVILRPIRAEDESAWHELLERCSDESIGLRFHALLKRTAHEVATRYCFVDYDRDMAIVAEVGSTNGPMLIGMGNLFGAPDGESAEYAVLVADDWQGKGLGTLLTDYCVQIAASWGRCHVYAETEPKNRRMLSLFQKQGFHVERRNEEYIRLGKFLAPHEIPL